MKTETRIVIADDHPIFRAGLKQIIENNPSFKVISDASDGETALNRVIEQKPDVVVLDVNMPKMTGLQVAEELKRKQCPTRVVFLTMHDDEAMFNKAMSLEVKGYVLKDSAAVDIINCLHQDLYNKLSALCRCNSNLGQSLRVYRHTDSSAGR